MEFLQTQLKENIENRNFILPATSDEQILRKQLTERVFNIAESYKENVPVSSYIIKSDIYKTLCDYIDHNRNVPDKSEIWYKLEDVVCAASPNFMTNIQILANSKLSTQDARIAMLMKCGFSTIQMSILNSRGRTTISSRQISLGKKLFKSQLTPLQIGNIMRLL